MPGEYRYGIKRGDEGPALSAIWWVVVLSVAGAVGMYALSSERSPGLSSPPDLLVDGQSSSADKFQSASQPSAPTVQIQTEDLSVSRAPHHPEKLSHRRIRRHIVHPEPKKPAAGPILPAAASAAADKAPATTLPSQPSTAVQSVPGAVSPPPSPPAPAATPPSGSASSPVGSVDAPQTAPSAQPSTP